MNIFISWSGVTSMLIAEKLKRFIPRIIQSAKPYYSPDMEKGIKWEAELNQKLSECVVGLICLTKNNMDKPWILFEAGALSNRFESSKVCSIAFGIRKSEITRPLSTFQLTEFEKTDFFKLMKSINSSLEALAIDESVLEESFDAFYPKFEQEVQEILENDGKQETDVKPERSEKDILEEILDIVRKQNNSSKIAQAAQFSVIEPVYYGGSSNAEDNLPIFILGERVMHRINGQGVIMKKFTDKKGKKYMEVHFDDGRIFNYPVNAHDLKKVNERQ